MMKNYALWAGLCLLAMTSFCKKDKLEPELENPDLHALRTSNTGDDKPNPSHSDCDQHLRANP